MRNTLSEQLFNHAIRNISPFASHTGHAWAAIPTSPTTHEAWPLASQRFQDWLAHSFFTEHNIFPGRQALSQSVRMLQAHARFGEMPQREIPTRIGTIGHPLRPTSLTIDLATPSSRIIAITPQGWTIRDDLGSEFLAVSGALPLPPPKTAPGNLVERLRQLLPVHSTLALHRIIAWLYSALRPAGPYPILILTGPPASGKSTIARILRTLIDPHVSPLQGLPRRHHMILSLALHNRVLAFDHTPVLSREMSDALARLASGTSFAQPGRHPLDQLEHFPLARPIILTVPQTDATAYHWRHNRTIMSLATTVRLDAIAPANMRSEQELTELLEQEHPAILATLCDALAASLSVIGGDSRPASRFAGAFHWTAAAAATLGLSLEDVHAAFATEPVIQAIIDLLDYRGEWTGTATELFNLLPGHAANPKTLSQLLNSLPLAVFGIHHESQACHDGRVIRLSATHRPKSASREDHASVAF
ncbi:MAG TPA: hypothetical protein VKU01_26295 [Bryobacteraceae bacterium]|nr:hypothetical protein [Bryobacteraceae bacterium]